jgi:hypothetical protein
MMKSYTLILLLALSGCATVKPVPVLPPVIIKTEYIVRIPPAELTTLPDPVPNIDIDTAMQSDVAAWLIKKEEYTKSLENRLVGISTFLNTPVQPSK